MKLSECGPINQSKLMKDYSEKNEFIDSFFDYSYQENDYTERQQELLKRKFQRKSLHEHLRKYNKKYNCSSATLNNIDKLLIESSVVVVGGQQAGILTGPLYTIHKIITILKLAKTQEEKLGVPVVPIFWIAGEDHDFDEINHIYTIQKGKLQKQKLKQINHQKQSVSNIPLDKRALETFTKEVLKHSKETKVTSLLLTEINKMIENSRSYVDFFNFLIHKLFENYGVVLLDSHDKELRQIEKPYFKQMIKSNAVLNDRFLEMANALFNEGYGEPIERSENNAHLFYHYLGSRLLLERTSTNKFCDKQNLVSFTKEELLELVEAEPHNFSNNVVTRPLMQEFLLPVLAFVGGPGEIAYWATLKGVFHLFELKLPPLVPRLSITIVSPQVNKWLNEWGLSAVDVMKYGTTSVRGQLPFWDDKERIDETLYQVLDKVEELHEPLKDLMKMYDKRLEALAHKNELILKREIQFFVQKIEKSVRQKYDHELLKFDLTDANIHPNNGLQERCLNIIQFLNEYGFEFVEKLVDLPFEFNNSHKVIYLN